MRIASRQKHWKQSWTYFITRQTDVQTFLRGVGPYLIVKRNLSERALKKLTGLVQRQETHARQAVERKNSVLALRRQGLTYRAIGQRLDIDWGYARRLFLSQTRHR